MSVFKTRKIWNLSKLIACRLIESSTPSYVRPPSYVLQVSSSQFRLQKKMPNEMAWMDSRDLSLVIIERTLLITLLRLYSTILVRTMISRDFLQIFRLLFWVFDAKVINNARVHRIIKTKQKSDIIKRINVRKCTYIKKIIDFITGKP